MDPSVGGGCAGPGRSLGLLRIVVQAQPQAREIRGQKGKDNTGRMEK